MQRVNPRVPGRRSRRELVVAERLTERIRSKFSGDASGFKTTFTDVARPALRECLQQMKVLPER